MFGPGLPCAFEIYIAKNGWVLTVNDLEDGTQIPYICPTPEKLLERLGEKLPSYRDYYDDLIKALSSGSNNTDEAALQEEGFTDEEMLPACMKDFMFEADRKSRRKKKNKDNTINESNQNSGG